jgi:hypothetical protein
MKNLIEISKIVTKKKVKKIEIFDEHTLKHKNSKFNEFYEALMANKLKNDRDAAAMLYNCSPTDDKYRQLKSRFRKRLLNTLFFLDINLPNTSNYDRAYYSCNKDWTLVKILLSNGADLTASTLARQILTIALKFKFADVIVNCSRILREYAVVEDDEKMYEQYDQYSKQFQDVLDAEIRSEELFQRVIMNYHKPQERNALSEKIDTYCEALKGLSDIYDSPIVIYNKYLVLAYRNEMMEDYAAVVEACTAAENYIVANPLYYKDDMVSTFQIKKMSAYFHLKDFTNAKPDAERFLQGCPQGSDIWFEIMEYYVLIALQTENYLAALGILRKAKSHTRFPKLMGAIHEKWNVIEIYLNFIVETQAVRNPTYISQRSKTFKVSKFLTDPISLPKEYRILTIQMIIGQALFFLEKKNYTAATERIEKLKLYATRQLKREEHFRAIQFIRLIQQLPKSEYNPEEFGNIDKYLARLKANPMQYRGLIHELEFIPYEKIWEIMLELIKDK